MISFITLIHYTLSAIYHRTGVTNISAIYHLYCGKNISAMYHLYIYDKISALYHMYCDDNISAIYILYCYDNISSIYHLLWQHMTNHVCDAVPPTVCCRIGNISHKSQRKSSVKKQFCPQGQSQLCVFLDMDLQGWVSHWFKCLGKHINQRLLVNTGQNAAPLFVRCLL